MWIYDFAFVANSEKCRKYTFLGGSSQIITILHGGVSEIYYNITWGGGVFPIYYNITWGGSLGTPNLYYVIYGRPLTPSIPSTFLITPHWTLKITNSALQIVGGPI